MIFLLMILAAAAVSAYAVKLTYRTEGLYSTSFFFAVGACLYFLAIPAEIILRGRNGYLISNVFDVVAEPVVFYKIFIMGLIAIVSFTVGYRLSGFHSDAPDKMPKGTNIPGCNALELAMWLMWGGSVAIITLFYSEWFVGILRSYTDSYKLQHANPLPSFILATISLLNVILGVLLIMRWKIVPVFIGAAMLAGNVLLAVLIYKKGPAIASILGIGYVYFMLVKNKKIVLIPPFAGLCFFIFGAANVFHGFFQVTDLTPSKLIPAFMELFEVTVTTIDPAGPMGVTVLTVKEDAPLMWGQSYVEGLSLFVPRALWPDRPLDIAESFGKRMMPNWLPGQGMGFGPVAEAYMNFGVIGSFIPFLAFGWLWGRLWRAFQLLTKPYNAPLHFDVLYRIIGFYVMIQFFRGFMVGSFKQLLMVMVPFALALAGMTLLVHIMKRIQQKKALA